MWLLARATRKKIGGRNGDALSVISRQSLSRGSSAAVVKGPDRARGLGVTEYQVTLLGEPGRHSHADRAAPTPPTPPTNPAGSTDGTVTVNVGGTSSKPSSSIVILIAMTVLSVAPALLLMCTSFTKIFVVLSITRNALGLA